MLVYVIILNWFTFLDQDRKTIISYNALFVLHFFELLFSQFLIQFKFNMWWVANLNSTSWFNSSLSQKKQQGAMFFNTFICVFKMTSPRLGWYFVVNRTCRRKRGQIGTLYFLWQLNSPHPHPSSFKTSLLLLFFLPQPLTDVLILCS